LIPEFLEPRHLLTGTASISGLVWNDLDGDGTRGATEPAASGITVYLDQNDNNTLDAGEPTKITAADGSYSFANLDAGNYVVRELTQANHRITSPQASGQRLFVIQSGSPPKIVELDVTTGAQIRSFAGPASGGPYGLTFDGQALWFMANGTKTLYKLNPDTGAALGQTVLSLSNYYDASIAAVGGKIYVLNRHNPSNGSVAIFDPVTNAITSSLTFQGGVYYGLADSLGDSPSTNELLAAAYHQVDFLDATTAIQTHSFEVYGFDVSGVQAVGNEVFVNHTIGPTIEVYSRSGTLLRTLNPGFQPGESAGWADFSGANRVALAAGQTLPNVNFGDGLTLGSIGGTRWQDANGNAVRDNGELPLAGKTMYLDLNDNGVPDAAEPTTATASDGSYVFSGLSAGSYVVREELAGGATQSYPASTKDRLFTSSYVPTPSKIYELNPATGAILNSFNAPFNGYPSLAFDGTSLYTIDEVRNVLYKINPDSGAVQASATLASGTYDGLAAANGLLYSYPIGKSFTIIDPVQMKVTGSLATSSNAETLWAVGQMTNPDRILGLDTDNQVVQFNPTTGAQSIGFTVAGTASVISPSASGNKLYVSDNSGHINVYSMPSGARIKTLNFAPSVDGLVYQAGTGGAQRLTIAAGQNATGLDFGTIEPPPPQTQVALHGGSVTITDASAQGSDNNWRAELAGANVKLTDLSGATIDASLVPGASGSGTSVVMFPLSLVQPAGSVIVNGGDGNDTLTIDLSGGNPIPPGGINFAGGNPTNGPGDKLTITGGNQGTATYNYTNAHDGSIVMSGYGTITYTGLEPIINTGSASDIVFNLPATASTAFLEDDGTSGNGLSRLRSGNSTIETTTFANPSNSLTINRGNAADTLTVNALPDFTAGLTAGSIASPMATITAAGAVSLAATRPLGAYGGVITVNAPLATSGGSLTLSATSGITLNSPLATGGGAVVLIADADGDGTGTLTVAAVTMTAMASWTQQANFAASDAVSGDEFGYSVAISGDGNTAIVGSYFDDIGANDSQGSAYVFVRSGNVWTSQQKLTAADGAGGDRFGVSVGLSADGNTAIVGAYLDQVGANLNQGSAYVFTRTAGVWTQQQKIVASDGAAGDWFGFATAISADGSTVIVGAYLDSIGANGSQGSAYVFARAANVWSQQQKLTASDGAAGDKFATTVDLSGDGNTAIVGARFHDVGANDSQGSAYVFVRAGGVWTQQQKVVAADGAQYDNFGDSVAISDDGNTALIGADRDDNWFGSAYVFSRSAGIWTQQQKLTPTNRSNEQFGLGVSLSGDGSTAAITSFGSSYQGAGYLFHRAGAVWTQSQVLVASDGAANDYFGNDPIALDYDGSTGIGGAQGHNSNQGAAYVFAAGQSQSLADTIAAAGGITIVAARADIQGAISTTGTGAVTIMTTRDISLAAGSSITTVNGDLTLSANQQPTPTSGGFTGVAVNGGTVQSTGTGNVTITGRGGTSGGSQFGVWVTAGGTIQGGTAGAVHVTGTGGSSSGSVKSGVRVINAGSRITSLGADIVVTGFGGAFGSFNRGVDMFSGGQILAGGTGTVTVTGMGGVASGNENQGVLVNGDGTSISSTSGTVIITGTGGGTGNALYDGGVVTTSGGALRAGGSGMLVIAGTAGNPAVTSNGVGTGGDVTTAGGGIVIFGTAANDTAPAVNLGGIVAPGAGGSVFISGDRVTIGAGGGINAPALPVTILPKTAGRAIDLGGDDSATALGLTDQELDLVVAGTLNIGDVDSGPLTITGDISRAAATDIALSSGDAVKFATGALDTDGGNLTLSSGALANVEVAHPGVDATVGASGTLNFAPGSFLAIAINGTAADSQFDQLNVAGHVDLTGVELFPSGTYSPHVGEEFVIVNNDGSDPIVGTFNGLPEGRVFGVNSIGGGGLDTALFITYAGGDGNDVVLTAVNTAPNFAKGADQTATDEDGVRTIPGWATELSPGLPGEAGQKLHFVIQTNSNSGLFAVPPAIAPDGTLTFTPAPNADGSAQITIALSDDGGTALGGADTSSPLVFGITVTKQHVWHNTKLAVDVDGDDTVAPIDALLVINYINSNASDQIPASAQDGPPYADVDNDGFIAPKDALQVINYINARQRTSLPAGEGEQAAPQPTADELLWLLAVDVSDQPRRRP
jgi:hypothetical protein